MSQLKNYVVNEFVLAPTATGVTAIREGRRTVFAEEHKNYPFSKYLAGQFPKHYRALDDIASDFASGNSSLEAVLGMIACMPNTPSFQNSHCGEITAAQFVEEILGYRRLYSKLTMTTSENTNAHKMDGLFVDTRCVPYEYLFVEAKSSILPTETTKTKTHRSGILKSMVKSLHTYDDDPRFEFARIRDNLEASFQDKERKKIKADLTPPGPENLKFLGISVTNLSTVNAEDDDFILSQASDNNFNYYALVVTDLAKLAEDAYGRWMNMRTAAA
ncbi:Hachiman antiphage defense system protein HamA [Burkholderia cenocepacia]|uniref:Hachiman antiphage defense system protein HamA n=1 Tax=Burkholderia cenocepacia TaxID=95486 RepID=UPI0029391C89|nr:Hachiman antiphage defense system protein HamA [Burkholderia cenocepacia]MDV3099809.1 DUF1837 domain-containing protein [Burkholderia cenocepacia]